MGRARTSESEERDAIGSDSRNRSISALVSPTIIRG